MLFVFIWLGFAVASGVVAGGKGRSAAGWFALGCLFGIFALIVVACLPSLIVAQANTGPMKQCPDCAEDVRWEAAKCRYCGHGFGDDMIYYVEPKKQATGWQKLWWKPADRL